MKKSRLFLKNRQRARRPLAVLSGVLIDPKRRVIVVRDSMNEYTIFLGANQEFLLDKRPLNAADTSVIERSALRYPFPDRSNTDHEAVA